MKTNLKLLTAAALMSFAVTAADAGEHLLRMPMKSNPVAQRTQTLRQTDRTSGSRKALIPYSSSKAAQTRAPQGPGEDDKLITEIPEGDTRTMVRFGMAYGYSWFTGLISEPLDGSVQDITFEENGDVYFKYPISFFFESENNYVKGHLDGDIITIKFPQLIAIEELKDDDGNITETYYDYALKLEFRPEEEGSDEGWYYASDNQDYRFKLNDDGSLTSLDSDYMIGQCNWMESETEPGVYGWSWQGNGDFVDSETVLTDKEIEVPEEARFEDWTLVDGFNARTLPIAFLGDKVYVKNIYTDQGTTGAIVGTLDGNKVTFSSDQYIGIAYMNQHTAYFMGGHAETITEGGESYDNFFNDGSLILEYDKNRKIMKTDSGAFAITSSDKKMWFTVTNHPYIAVPDPDAEVSKLYAPRIDTFYPAEEGYEAEMLFTIPAIDQDKNVLDPSRYFYELILDDEVFTFHDDEYELPEGMTEMTEVPVDYTSDNAYDFYAYGTNHGIVIYPQGYESLGIRTLYKGKSTVYSDITWVPGYESGVRGVAEDAQETDVCFYTIDGVVSNAAERGIYIREARLNDGTVRRSKTLVTE